MVRLDPTGLRIETIPVGNGPSAIAVGERSVWVADTPDNKVQAIDPTTNSGRTTIDVGRSPTALAVGAGGVWVANSGDGTVTRIDPRNDRPTTLKLGGTPAGIAVANGLVWVSVQGAGVGPGDVLAASRTSGTARIDLAVVDQTDPALSYNDSDWQIELATCARLVGYPDLQGRAGTQLVPEVARSLPTLSRDRRTYTFWIRRGYRFSPPSNEPVTAQTFKHALERSLDPRMYGPAPSVWGDIEGVKAYEAGTASDVAGIRVRGDTLAIHLTHVSGSFLSRLAMPFSCAVPLDTPVDPKGLPAIAAAGPYYIASYDPGHQSS